jgi:hypothetical protein
MAQVVEHLLSQHETLSSNRSTKKKEPQSGDVAQYYSTCLACAGSSDCSTTK